MPAQPLSIESYTSKDRPDLITCMEWLVDYLAEVDPWKLICLTPQFRDVYITDMLTKVRNSRGQIYIARLSGQVAGAVVGIIQPTTPAERSCEKLQVFGKVLELSVLPSYRRQGIGKRLLQRMESYFMEKGCEMMQLEVMTANREAKAFYSKLGLISRSEYYAKRLKGGINDK